MIPISGNRFFTSRMQRGTSPSGLNASRLHPSVLSVASITGKSVDRGHTPNTSACSTTRISSSMLRQERLRASRGTGSTTPRPSRTNTGRMRSSAERRDSRTRRRVKSSRRFRRMRRPGNRPRVEVISAGTLSRGGALISDEGLLLPRFSSLSGRLNPIKAFFAPALLPFSRGFLFSGNELQERRRGLRDPLILEAGKRAAPWHPGRLCFKSRRTFARVCCAACFESLSDFVRSTCTARARPRAAN